MISVSVDRRELIVGQQVRVQGSWQADRQPKAVKVELRWQTEGRGTTDHRVADGVRFEDQGAGLQPVFETVLTVPREGPVSYQGSLIRVRWMVRVSLEVSWARDPREEVELTVVPATIDG